MRRFIAGAICPKCQRIDKIVVYRKDETEYCECVRCGYQQQQETEVKPALVKLGQKEQIIKVIRDRRT